MTNAVRHTGCRTTLRVTIHRQAPDAVRIAVRDGSRTLPPCLIVAEEFDEGHRGLALVHHLTGGQWGVALGSSGKVVHADLRLDGAVP
ncbi:ATP-binding protein [Kitasatospora acidiphila]|uniref:ATP-binding protein n=1 Tax=Kitasatospora acidiphila TaxID=2567942 RepID=UPI003C70CD03